MLLRRIARPLLASGFVIEGLQSLRDPGPLADALSPLVGAGRTEPGVAIAPPETLARSIAATEVGAAIMLGAGKMPRAASGILAAISVLGLAANTFWTDVDDELRRKDTAGFISGVSRVGALLIAAADTEGKPSLGWRGRHAAASALEHAQHAADYASDKASELVHRG